MLIIYFYFKNQDIASDDESDNQPKSVLRESNKTNALVENPSTSASQHPKIIMKSNIPAKQNIKPIYIQSEFYFSYV